MTPAEAEALRSLRAALAVLHEYSPSCSLHFMRADEVRAAIGADGVDRPLWLPDSARDASRLIYDTRLSIFTDKETT